MVSGDAYAILDSPFTAVSATFKNPGQWCDVMILHLNTKYCRPAMEGKPVLLKVNMGKKTEQELSDTFALEFAFQPTAVAPNFLSIELSAEKGPLGTKNYLISLSAMPLPEGKTFMHLRYSYGYGLAGRLAMQSYLATMGSGKAGFTQLGQGGKQRLVGGMRGAVERNTMRYYLAIESYLATLGLPAPQQLNARLERWFDATEQYPDQFHDIDKNSYMTMKKIEQKRQLSGSAG